MKRIFSTYYFLFFVAAAASQPFLSLYLSSKGISSTRIGLILATGSVAGMLVQPMVGLLNDRARDPRLLLLISAIVSPFVFAGYAVTTTFYALIGVSILLAMIQSTSPIADALAVAEGERSHFTYGQIRLWGALSYALTTMIAGYVYGRIGIGSSFGMYAGLSLIVACITWFLPRTAEPTHTREVFLRGLWTVVKNLRLASFIVICFILSLSITMNFTFLPLYFKALHYPLGLVGLNFTVAALTEVPLFYVSGQLMKQIGKLPVVLIATACYAAKFVIMALAPGAITVIVIQVLDGIGYALYWSASVQIVSDIAPIGKSATAQTLFGAMAGSLSNIVGLTIGGWVMQRFGPLALYGTMAGVACLAFLGFLGFFYMQNRISHQTHGVQDSPPRESL